MQSAGLSGCKIVELGARIDAERTVRVEGDPWLAGRYEASGQRVLVDVVVVGQHATGRDVEDGVLVGRVGVVLGGRRGRRDERRLLTQIALAGVADLAQLSDRRDHAVLSVGGADEERTDVRDGEFLRELRVARVGGGGAGQRAELQVGADVQRAELGNRQRSLASGAVGKRVCLKDLVLVVDAHEPDRRWRRRSLRAGRHEASEHQREDDNEPAQRFTHGDSFPRMPFLVGKI